MARAREIGVADSRDDISRQWRVGLRGRARRETDEALCKKVAAATSILSNT